MDHGTRAARAQPVYVENKEEHPVAEIRNGVFA